MHDPKNRKPISNAIVPCDEEVIMISNPSIHPGPYQYPWSRCTERGSSVTQLKEAAQVHAPAAKFAGEYLYLSLWNPMTIFFSP